MRKFLLKIFWFGVSFCFCSLLLILATEIEAFANYLPSKLSLPKGTTSHQWTRQSEADTTKHIDVLILGSSLSQCIDVRTFEKLNLRAFNLSSGSQSPIQSSYFLDRYLCSFDPKLIIWDVNPYTFSQMGTESTLDIISNSKDGEGMIPMLIRTNSMLAWASYIKRRLLLLFEDENIRMPLKTAISQYYSGGYMEAFLDASDTPLESDEVFYTLRQYQDEVFVSELKRLKKRAIPVILLYSPKSNPLIQNFKNQDYWFDYFNAMVENGLALKFLNLNELFIADSSKQQYFYDLSHLSQQGAKAYNRILMDSLRPHLYKIRNK